MGTQSDADPAHCAKPTGVSSVHLPDWEAHLIATSGNAQTIHVLCIALIALSDDNCLLTMMLGSLSPSADLICAQSRSTYVRKHSAGTWWHRQLLPPAGHSRFDDQSSKTC